MALVGPLKTCDYCTAEVREADYAKHLAVTHRLTTVPDSQPMPPTKGKRRKGRGGWGSGGSSGANWWCGGA